MLFAALCLLLLLIGALASSYQCPVSSTPVQIGPDDKEVYERRPFIDGTYSFIDGDMVKHKGNFDVVTSPIIDSETGQRTIIGKIASMSGNDSLSILDNAKLAWKNGRGVWPQMKALDRIDAIEKSVLLLKKRRDEIINVLTWEICKSVNDATLEFDRTMDFIEASIKAYKDTLSSSQNSVWKTINGIIAKVRRAAIGIMLCLGPFNYPFNETYATLIPALLSGNIVIMKIPTIGGLAHMLTMEVYKETLPKGTLQFITGGGRETIGPIMKTGDIDILAFIGGSKAADAIIKDHPHPHRLKVFLQLEGKNLGIVLPNADIDISVEQAVLGSLSFNGQRCTAIKLIFVHESIAAAFNDKLINAISLLKFGSPWVANVSITPLPELKKPAYLEELIKDALSKGAMLINEKFDGGVMHGNLMVPAVLYPVTSDMKVWHEEQFGPVVPVAEYADIEEVYDYIAKMPYGQQAAIFTTSPDDAAPIVDVLSTVVGRVNINTQCGRSPDSLPFSGRRSSAMGTMSITEALNVFSVETVVAAKKSDINENILLGVEKTSRFLHPLE